MFRKYVYLMALARERHFGRAAAACHVSQPTLSNAIRQLEEDLGVPIVERGQRFQGFTPQGQAVLKHARRILAAQEELHQELHVGSESLTGQLRLGVIPTALPSAAHLLGPFAERFPQVRTVLRSESSRGIQRGLEEFELDVGITYLDNEPLPHVRMMPLYSERYFLLTRRTPDLEGLDAVPWAKAADFNLCLLTPDMQNRRIAEAAFRMADRVAAPTMETNSIMTLFTMARLGPWASVVPGQMLTVVTAASDLIALPLTQPDVTYVVGLVHAERDPPLPLVQALLATASEQRVTASIAEYTREALARHGLA